MQRKSFSDMQCPIARGLEHVGEWWSILILRDAFRGLSRFDEFSENLGIAPNMLTRRLTSKSAFASLQNLIIDARGTRSPSLSPAAWVFITISISML